MNVKYLLAFLPALLLGCGGGDDDASSSGGSSGTAGTGAVSGTGGSSGAGGSSGTGGSSGSGAGTGGSSGSAQCGSTMLTLSETNNYSFSSVIRLTAAHVKPNAELMFDWSGLSVDFLGRGMSPTADIDSVLLVVFHITLQELEQHINADDGLAPFNDGALQLVTNNTLTSSSLYDFGVPGVPENTYRTSDSVKTTVDEYLDPTITDPATHTMVVMPASGLVPGAGNRMIQPFVLDPASDVASLTLTASTPLAPGTDGHSGGAIGTSTSVTYDVNLTSILPIMVPPSQPAITIDWTQLATNGIGRPWQARSILLAMVGHYSKTLTELQDDFLNLQGLADELYTGDVPSDEPYSLSALATDTGAAFPGIDSSGTWIMALFCDPRYCGNPAPWYLTVLEPCN